MSIQVAARGTVARGPEPVETADGEPAAAFLLMDAQFGRYADEIVSLDHSPVCEVVVRGVVADPVLRRIQRGDAVLALGLLKITIPLGVANEADLVSLSIEAYAIGSDLAAVSHD